MDKSELMAMVRRFAAWYRLVRSLRFLQVVAFAALCAFAGYMLVDRLFYLGLEWE